MTERRLPEAAVSAGRMRKNRYLQQELNQEFYSCIEDIVYHPVVMEMKKFYQHCETDCYRHCLSVAYYNFRICKALRLDARSAARGGTVSYTHLCTSLGRQKSVPPLARQV